MAVSVLVVVGAAVLARALARRLGSWNAGTLAVLAGVGVVAVTYLVLPGVDEIPADFPAGVLWEFRLASIGLHVTAWAAIGLLFGALTDRAPGRNVVATAVRAGSGRRTGGHPPLTTREPTRNAAVRMVRSVPPGRRTGCRRRSDVLDVRPRGRRDRRPQARCCWNQLSWAGAFWSKAGRT